MLRSAAITQGIQRSPNRAMLRAVGFGDGDFNKPIGVGASLEIQVTTVASRLPVNLSAVTSSDGEVLEITGTSTNKFVVHGLSPGTSPPPVRIPITPGFAFDIIAPPFRFMKYFQILPKEWGSGVTPHLASLTGNSLT